MAQKITTLIVDDERLARERLNRMLTEFETVEIVGQAKNGLEAVNMIADLQPDIVFLDIQMPGLNGFEVLDKIPVKNRPRVVFVTAYDQFAIKAFEIQALDYLLKPFSKKRLALAVERLVKTINRPKTKQRTQMNKLLKDAAGAGRIKPRYTIKVDDKIILLDYESIIWISAAGNYSEINSTGNKKYFVREPLKQIESNLPQNQFVRIHRSTIVNIDQIKELLPRFRGDYTVVLNNKTKLNLSRRYKENLLNLLD